jgi:hypothetical protein
VWCTPAPHVRGPHQSCSLRRRSYALVWYENRFHIFSHGLFYLHFFLFPLACCCCCLPIFKTPSYRSCTVVRIRYLISPSSFSSRRRRIIRVSSILSYSRLAHADINALSPLPPHRSPKSPFLIFRRPERAPVAGVWPLRSRSTSEADPLVIA